MDNLRRALALRWCRMANRQANEVIEAQAREIADLREIIGVQAESIDDAMTMLTEHRTMGRDIAVLALEVCPEDHPDWEMLRSIAEKLRDRVAMFEEYGV